MEIAEVKKILKSAWFCKLQVERETEEIAQLRALATQVTPAYSLAPGSGSGNNQKLEGNAIRIVEAERKRQQTVAELLNHLEEIHKLVDKLDDDQLRILLKLRYVNHKKWEEIALMMDYDWRYVHKLHAKALQQLAKRH